MPLKQLSFKRVDSGRVESIKRNTDGKASLAIDLIVFDPRAEAAM